MDSMPPHDPTTSPDNPYAPEAQEKPICVALIVCNEVVEDRRTGNKTLVGLFSNIMTAQLPAVHARLFLMASLTSGTGTWPFTFRILSPSGREVMRMQDAVRFVDPLIVHDLVVEVRNLPLEETGVYFIDLLLAGTPIANRRFTVQLETSGGIGADVPPPPPPNFPA